MRRTRVWARLLGLGAAVVEDVYFGDEGEVVVAVRPRSTGWASDRDGAGRAISLAVGNGPAAHHTTVVGPDYEDRVPPPRIHDADAPW